MRLLGGGVKFRAVASRLSAAVCVAVYVAVWGWGSSPVLGTRLAAVYAAVHVAAWG